MENKGFFFKVIIFSPEVVYFCQKEKCIKESGISSMHWCLLRKNAWKNFCEENSQTKFFIPFHTSCKTFLIWLSVSHAAKDFLVVFGGFCSLILYFSEILFLFFFI